MKLPFLSKRFSIIAFICIVALGLIISFTISQSQPAKIDLANTSLTRPPNCVPLPWLSKDKNSVTPLPSLPEILKNPELIKTIPTVKPDKISNTYDLRPDLARNQKLSVYVFRCNGTEDLYLVDPITYNSGNAIFLDKGDVIIGVSSPADMYFHGGPPTPTSPFTATASQPPKLITSTPSPKSTQSVLDTLPAYPPPIPPTPTATPIISPYPY